MNCNKNERQLLTGAARASGLHADWNLFVLVFASTLLVLDGKGTASRQTVLLPAEKTRRTCSGNAGTASQRAIFCHEFREGCNNGPTARQAG